MIYGAKIERFRGIRELAVEGFGRVNLLIGKNDCGKTALLEALAAADTPNDAAHYFNGCQRRRMNGGAKPADFNSYWRPLFFNLQASLGLTVSVADGDTRWSMLELREGAKPDEIVSNDDRETYGTASNWSLDLRVRTTDQESLKQIVAVSDQLRLPPATNIVGPAWIGSGASLSTHDVRLVSQLKQADRDGELLELLREADPRVTGIEILSPYGDVAQLFVRLESGVPLLPVALMGEGFQRCIEFATVACANDWPTVFIDEIENGMHHLLLEPLWRWIAKISARRNLQIFVTTHSEECIQAACRAFGELADDGLRVIRLDRMADGTRAVVYDRTLLEAAARTDTEIRG